MTMYNSNYNGAYPFSDQSAQIALTANTELTYTIPGDNSISYRCEFKYAYNTNIWVGYNTTAAVAAGGAVTATNKIELNPTVRYVRGGDVLHFISDSIVANAGLNLLQVP